MIEIEKMPSGFLQVIKDEQVYKKVNIMRLFPYRYLDKYIAITDEDDEEIEIIKDLSELDEKSRKLIVQFLDYKYYIPEITKVNTIKEKMGYIYIDLDTTAGNKLVCVGDFTSNIRLIKNKILNITDVEGDKYTVSDINTLDSASKQKLDLFL